MNNKILFPFIALCMIWGSTWYFIKISLNAGVPPFYGVGLRFLFSGIIFYLYIYYKNLSIPFTPQAIKLYLSFGLLNFSLSYGMTYWATQYIFSSISSILWGLFPLFTSLMAHFMIKEDISVIIWTNELIFSTLYLIIFGGFISWGIYFWLYQYLNVTQVTYVAIFPPIVAILLGWVFLGEILTTKEIIGTLFILGSSILIYRK